MTDHALDANGVALRPTPALRHWRWLRRAPAAGGDGAILELTVSLAYDDVHYSYFVVRQSLQVVQGGPVSFDDALKAVRRSGVSLTEGVWRPSDGIRKPVRPSKSSTDTTPGEVYFAQSVLGGPIKIGFTAKRARERIMRQCRAGDLRLLVAIPGTLADEAAFHRRFAGLLVKRAGEWFYAEPDLCNFIKQLRRGELAA